jgi:hypothetical protein
MENLTYQTFSYDNENYVVAKQIVYGGKTYLLSIKTDENKEEIKEEARLFELSIDNDVKSVQLVSDANISKKINDYILNNLSN